MSSSICDVMVNDKTDNWMDIGTSEKLADLDDYATRSFYGLDSDHSLHHGAITDKLANDFDLLKESNWEARPHINLEIDADNFSTALDEALNGERKSFSIGEHGDLDVVPHLRNGFVDILIQIQEFELYLSVYEMGDRAEKLSEEELEIIEEYYSSGAIHIQQKPSLTRLYPPVSSGYLTLLRDMSEDCCRVADKMYSIVDEYEDLYWEEPKLQDTYLSYLFSSRLHYRGG